MTIQKLDSDYLIEILFRLLDTPSPSGFTDAIVHLVADELDQLNIPFELTRRGAIRADLKGAQSSPDRALVAHLDTLGGMVMDLKDNGRLSVAPIGTWSSRFAEGARVTVFTQEAKFRGTIMPLKASGHRYNDEVDSQPVTWDQVEIRPDVQTANARELRERGFNIGDFVAIDPQPEKTDTGFIVSRHLDNKVGVACLLAAAKSIQETGATLPVDCHLLFTIFEEVGSGASAVLHQDVAEMVSVDNGVVAPDQNSSEFEVSVAFMDQSGPFDYHLSHHLLAIADQLTIPTRREVYRFYRSDAATAVEAGNDIRTALIGVGVDSSHGYERTHIDGMIRLTALIAGYLQSEPVCIRDRKTLGPLTNFPSQI